MMETTSKLGVVNEVSVSLKEDTPWEADKGIRVASKNEYSVNPASSLNSKRKVSIPLEGIDPLEIFEEMNMNESGEDSALEAESIFAFKVSSGKEESNSWPLNAWDRSALHSKTSTSSSGPPVTECGYYEPIRNNMPGITPDDMIIDEPGRCILQNSTLIFVFTSSFQISYFYKKISLISNSIVTL